jgi:CRP/FNR family transcriptional regulator, anaerobic regulatory protein
MMVPFEHMDYLIKNYPKWYYFLLETYHSRFQELLLIVDQIAFRSLDQKLEFYLKRQFNAMKSTTISVTHQEIAADLNSSREVISRLLKKLEADNLIFDIEK